MTLYPQLSLTNRTNHFKFLKVKRNKHSKKHLEYLH